ncbi:Chorion class B protein Ld10 [Papilio machaon]|uniref:Chorion class B protein Ld10 n=1 Tax=Papilio machaon TaxID=76193 RepID=A0A194QZN6_PAPMA|nr:Chorion class B protein Ld10 [Papilio machaon]
MSAKTVLLFCLQAFLAHSISAYCGAGLGYEAPLMGAAPFGAGPLAGYGAGCGCGLAAIPTSSGGGFPTSSASPIPPPSAVSFLSWVPLVWRVRCLLPALVPSLRLRQRCRGHGERRHRCSKCFPHPTRRFAVLSENEIGGILAVGGELPFLGTVGLEGALPTAGAGAVSYGCGNGAVGMVSEDIAAPAWGYPAAAGFGYGPGLAAGIGYGPAIAGRAIGGCGCGIY